MESNLVISQINMFHKLIDISHIKQNHSTGQYMHKYKGENTDKI